MIYLRSFLFNIICYTIIFIGSVVTSIVGIFSQKLCVTLWGNFFQKISAWFLKMICGLEIEVRGAENLPESGAIFASKHQSAMETYFLVSHIKNSNYILKKELTYIPIFGWAVKAYGCVAIDRSKGIKSMKQMLNGAKKSMESGRNFIIFPEGTRTKPGMKTNYKPGIAFLYQNLNAPVIPVAINTGMFWKKRSFLRHKGKVVFEFLEPMEPNMDKKEFIKELQKRIEDKCAELNQEAIASNPEVEKNLIKPIK
jgi:1-acyl-sn-glycerol-3-phosphate acyltransferase